MQSRRQAGCRGGFTASRSTPERDNRRRYPHAVDTSVKVPDRGSREPGPKDDVIIETVVAQIQEAGYDAVDLRTIARDAQVSLATIYRSFPSRDALLLAAMKQWMGRQVYEPISVPDPQRSVSDRLSAVMHGIFEPWLDNPRMLEAFVRATERSGGIELSEQGSAATAPRIYACFDDDADPADVDEILTILRHVVSALMAGYAHRELRVDELLPDLDMTVRRLTRDMTTATP